MTYFSISDMSGYMNELLRQKPCGTVHSVYRKTINLSIGGTLAALQAKGSPLSPISLITTLTSEELALLEIKVNDIVTIQGDNIIIHKSNVDTVSFSFNQAKIHNLDLKHSVNNTKKRTDISALSTLHCCIKKSLSQISTGGFEIIFNHRIDADTSMMLIAANNKIKKCTDLYTDKKYKETGIELARLIGLGIGLTPSGDDFLCGILAGLILTGQTESEFVLSLKSSICEHLSDTVDVSAAFLQCALKGQFSLAVNHLATATVENVPKIIEEFLAIGHSSGTDTLCGILYMLELIFNQKS